MQPILGGKALVVAWYQPPRRQIFAVIHIHVMRDQGFAPRCSGPRLQVGEPVKTRVCYDGRERLRAHAVVTRKYCLVVEYKPVCFDSGFSVSFEHCES